MRLSDLGEGGVALGHEYDPDSELVSQVLATRGGATLGDFGYDFNGFRELEIRTANDPVYGSRSETFTYDGLGRVATSQVASTPAPIEYGYDAIGNLLSRSDQPQSGFDGPGPHMLTSIGADLHIYDANGALESNGSATITWSSFGKPAQVSTATSVDVYSYGPDRERIRRTSTSSGETLYVGDLYEADVVSGGIGDQRAWVTIAGETRILLTRSAGVDATTYQVSDHLGSTTMLLDSAGNVVDQVSNGVFGEARNPDWTPGGQIQLSTTGWDRYFTGQRLERSSGLYDFGARFYSPGMSRFLSPDPVLASPGMPQLLNPYSYVLNNPLQLVDPTGMEAVDAGDAGSWVDDFVDWLVGDPYVGDNTFVYDSFLFEGTVPIYQTAQNGVFLDWSVATEADFWNGLGQIDPFRDDLGVGWSNEYGFAQTGVALDYRVEQADPSQSDSLGVQVAALGTGLGTGALVGGGTAYAVAGLTAVCLPCGVAVGVGALAYAGYELYQDSQNDFAGVRGFGSSVGNVLSGSATASEAFQVGFVGGSIAGGIAGSRAGYAAGRLGSEIRVGSNIRVAPFGNRTGHPTGRFTHYHRRVPDPSKPGQSFPGQGIGRHRPWDARSTDTSFWDRF